MRCSTTSSPKAIPIITDTIGSMADLDAASLADVKQWFIDKYGPNNAVLVLAGDINAAEARPLVEKYFGAIPRGPVNNPAAGRRADAGGAQVDRDEGPRRRGAAVSATGPCRACSTDQLAALDLGGSILGGLASSRLDKILVRDEKLAVVGHAPGCSRSSASASSRSRRR